MYFFVKIFLKVANDPSEEGSALQVEPEQGIVVLLI